MLNCEINTLEMKNRIIEAAKKHFKNNNIIACFEENEQWFIFVYNKYNDKNSVYNVCDAEGIGTTNGFDFEELP